MLAAFTIRTTCPRDCYDACGVLVKTSADGTINVVGDPDHHVSRGALCGKCSIGYNGVWRDPSVRLTRPLKRVGTERQRPVSSRSSWDEALGDIADRLNVIRERDGASCDPANPLHRNLLADRRHLPLPLLQSHRRHRGRSRYRVQQGRARRSTAHVRRIDARLRPAHHRRRALRDDLGRQSIDVGAACPSILARRDAPSPKIVVDPIRHETAAAADIHLQLYPGTDGALAFAMLHVIRAAGPPRSDFLAAHCDRLGGDRTGTRCVYAGLGRSTVTGVPAASSRKRRCSMRKDHRSVDGARLPAPDLWR